MALSYNSAAARPIIRRAGQLFGLNLLDLFTDEQSEQGDFDPNLTFTATGRGRGAGLTYRPQQQSTLSSTLSLVPNSGGGTTDPNPNPNPNPNPDPNPGPDPDPAPDTRKSLRDIADQYGSTSLFGHQDYRKAVENYGYTNEEVQKYLNENPYMLAESNRAGTGNLMDEINRGSVDTSKANIRGADPAFKQAFKYSGAPQISTKFGQDSNYFGAEDLKAAKMSGYSESEIGDFLNKNQNLLRGPNVYGGDSEIAAYLKNPNESGGGSSTGGGGGGNSGGSSGYNFSAQYGQSSDFFGHKDYDAAKAGGASDAEIKSFLDKNLGLLRAGNVKGGGGLYDQIASRAGG